MKTRHKRRNMPIWIPFTQAQYLSTQSQETRTLTAAMKARQKRRVAGPTTGCSPKKFACTEEKQRVRQPAVRYTQKNKQTNVHTCVSVYGCMYEERERISVTLVTVTTSRVCQWSLHVRARAYVCWYYFVISLLRLFVYRCTPWHKHTHTINTKNTGQYMSSNDGTPTLSIEHSISVLRHEKHAHSPKQWKPGKNAGWQGGQLVARQKKNPVSRRNKELGNQR